MSERFGIPDRSPQHAPDHSLQNPTAQGNWHNIGGGSDGAWPAAPTYGGGGGYASMPYVDTRTIALSIGATSGGDNNRVWTALVAMWCITVPWAIAGVRWRNRRFKTAR